MFLKKAKKRKTEGTQGHVGRDATWAADPS